jgi:hypothetical protein
MRKSRILSVALLVMGVMAGACAYGQGQAPPDAPDRANAAASQAGVEMQGSQKQPPSAGRDIGSGAGDIGKGVGKGAGDLAVGTGKGAVDLVTLHPINAAGDIGKGGAKAGKNIGVGAVKGAGKIAKGTGKAIKKVF